MFCRRLLIHADTKAIRRAGRHPRTDGREGDVVMVTVSVNQAEGVTVRPISGFPGYQISSDGIVFGQRGKPIKPFFTPQGYCMAALRRNGKSYFRRLHHLVLEAFVGPRPPGMCGCHYPNPDKQDNRLQNLRWDTHEENCKDRYRARLAIQVPEGYRSCKICGEIKLATDFWASMPVWNSVCRACRKQREKEAIDGLQLAGAAVQ